MKVGWMRRDAREIFEHLIRIIGASTKTPIVIYPSGNTRGANVSPFKPVPIPEDLRIILHLKEQ